MAHAMGLVRADLAERGGRSVALAHCFAADVEPTPGVEREIRQGTLDVVPLAAFDGPDYVALGHIHGRATLSERVRYAGAPLHYSFGEADKPRGSWLVELDAGGLASVEWVELPVPRRLKTLRGTLDELLRDQAFEPFRDAWICAQLTDATPQLEPMRKLQTRFRWCASIQPDPQGRPPADGVSYAARRSAAPTDPELIDAFLSHVRAGEGASEQEAALVGDVVTERRVSEVLA
jgi:exonuclease SbcD